MLGSSTSFVILLLLLLVVVISGLLLDGGEAWIAFGSIPFCELILLGSWVAPVFFDSWKDESRNTNISWPIRRVSHFLSEIVLYGDSELLVLYASTRKFFDFKNMADFCLDGIFDIATPGWCVPWVSVKVKTPDCRFDSILIAARITNTSPNYAFRTIRFIIVGLSSIIIIIAIGSRFDIWSGSRGGCSSGRVTPFSLYKCKRSFFLSRCTSTHLNDNFNIQKLVNMYLLNLCP